MNDNKFNIDDHVLVRVSFADYKLGRVMNIIYSSYRVQLIECGKECYRAEDDLIRFIEPDVNNMVSI